MTRSRSVALALALLVSYAYFYQAGGWNQNSRFDLVRALTEHRTLRIDGYDQNTGDKAVVNGHVYSDKAPGQALTAVPAVAVGEQLARLMGFGENDNTVAVLAYLATVWAAGLPTVVAALSLANAARRLGATPGGAAFAAVSFGLGTPAWAYATLLWGNALAAGCLMAAFATAVALHRVSTPARDRGLAVLTGVAAGWAVLTEYQAAPAACIVVTLALVHGWRGHLLRARRVGGWVTLGALAPALILGAYNLAAFGSPLHIAYQNVDGFSGMQQGLLGVTSPKRAALEEILFGGFRGLLPLAPVLAVAPLGLVLLWRRSREARPAVAAAAAVATYYLLLNSSYVYWDGGASFGPRLVGAALPFMCLGLAEIGTRARGLAAVLLALLAGYGFAVVGMAVSTAVMLPNDVSLPIVQIVWPDFLHGNLAINHWTFGLEPGAASSGLLKAWNVGQLLGLNGLASLLPLLLAWILMAALCLSRTMTPGQAGAWCLSRCGFRRYS